MAAHEMIQVVVRVRPLNEEEILSGSKVCLEVFKKESQIILKVKNQKYTFNHVFSDDTGQQEFYDSAVKELLKQLFKGYNVTILAYGQTGSGKTFTMGTNFIPGGSYPKGVIPLAIEDIFRKINSDDKWEYSVTASFIELYQEQVYDLLSDRPKGCSVLDIREDTGGVHLPNLTEKPISSVEETFHYLQQGALSRATRKTAINMQSSRSHAIFTVSLNFNKKDNIGEAMAAKFHLVDLAGSERYKKTKSSGERFREGVNINKGLLVLGNVISALGDGNQGYISYRDSKLTRLLQDSLGGNSQTLMIACVSPCECNQDETANTLRYADRARQIKNRPIINQDPKVAENVKLKKENEQLKLEVNSLKAFSEGSDNWLPGDGDSNYFCAPEDKLLDVENDKIKTKMIDLLESSTAIMRKNYTLSETVVIAERVRKNIKGKLIKLNEEYNQMFESFRKSENLSESALQQIFKMQLKISELLAEQERSEEEILNLDMNSKTIVKPGLIGSLDTLYDMSQMRENNLFNQAELSYEFQTLTKNLASKEKFIKQFAESSERSSRFQEDSMIQMKDLQEQIEILQKIRDELSEQIRKIQQRHHGENKLTDQRREKLKEMEQKICVLHKKVSEQAKMIKMKGEYEVKINDLQNEILVMKQNKVCLIQQMKSESKKVRLLRLTNERELCKLRDQDRRCQSQIIRKENLHDNRQNVLKRKVEEVAAVNKRLKNIINVKKVAQERIASANESNYVTYLLDKELEILLSVSEAEQTIELLKGDNIYLKNELEKLMGISTADLTSEYMEKIEFARYLISQAIELRSKQIVDLEQKILDISEGSKWNSYIDQLDNLMAAKNTIQLLYTIAIDAKKHALHAESTLTETRVMCTELKEQLKNYEKKLTDVKIRKGE